MKTKYTFGSMLLAGLLAVGCTDMDTQPDGYYVTPEQKAEIVESNPERAAAGVTGIFAQMSTYMSVTGSRHNDFGYPSIMLFTDQNGMDVVSQDNGYNWCGNSLDYSDRVYTSNESRIVWNTLYGMIFSANNVIASLDPNTSDPTIQGYLGEALADRAFNYWNLAQLYQFNYADHKSAPCVPLVTDENAATVPVDGAPRATVQEVYDQIMKDANQAITLLTAAKDGGWKRADKRYIDLGVAYGIRARVNLTMENWAAAAADAQAAIEASGATPYGLNEANKPAFNALTDHAWMWGIYIDETDRVVTSGIVNWPSHMGSFNYGYCWYSGGRQINKALYDTISDTDIRKGWFTDENGLSANLTEDQQWVISDYVEYVPYTQVKFAPYKDELLTSTNAVDIPLMRVEEMYLIKAEGEAMSGGNGAATLQEFVQAFRDPEYTCDLTGTALQDEIWRQRRVEFWGEGLAWFDIMRLNKDVDRRGGLFPDATMVFNIPAGSNVLLWRIPESEIQANPSLAEGDNNPAAPLPDPVADIEY